MKKIKVCLQYPWKFSKSAYTKSLIENPPFKIDYLNTFNRDSPITRKTIFKFSNLLKISLRKLFSNLKISLPNAHNSKIEDCDLIHCSLCLSKSNYPWVADFEGEWQFYIGKKNKYSIERVRKIITSKNCKKIMPWTLKAKEEIISQFPEIKQKVEVAYPAIPLPNIKRKKHKEINLVFVARYFDQKGGYHALEVMKRLTKKYPNVKGIIVSTVPKEIIEQNKNNKKITFYPLMPQEEVFEKVYSIADISIYPGYADSFGFGILEAMSFGIPVITVEGYSKKELITEGKTGFIIKFPPEIKDVFDVNQKEIGPNEEEIIREIIRKTEYLIKSKKVADKIGKNALNEIKTGKFSINRRNETLKRVYEEALI